MADSDRERFEGMFPFFIVSSPVHSVSYNCISVLSFRKRKIQHYPKTMKNCDFLIKNAGWFNFFSVSKLLFVSTNLIRLKIKLCCQNTVFEVLMKIVYFSFHVLM